MKRDIIESDDSDNDITNLNNIPPRQRLETETENENDKVKMKPQPLPVNQEMTDYKALTLNTNKYIIIFIIALSVTTALFILNISLALFIWINKASFFAKIFCLIGIFSLLVIIFNLVSVLIFKKKFGIFTDSLSKTDTELEILREGDLYDNLQQSTESSLMNLGMYLLMFVILIHFVFMISSFAFPSQVKTEINSYANSSTKWRDNYGILTYNEVSKFLTSFVISFGFLSLLSCGVVGYLFYISFCILGFFRIYQKIVQFTSMLFIQLGIVFLYLTISLSWFKQLSLIEKNFVSWLPMSLIVSSSVVICIGIIGYVGATKKSVKILIAECVISILFIGTFIVFSICSVISANSLEKYGDYQCPVLMNYFNNDYVRENLKCDKYSQVEEEIDELNCPKSRIVLAWEVDTDKSLDNELKKHMYGCINMSCCYSVYDLAQSFTYYISIICFCLILFGLLLIGTTIFLVILIQEKRSVGADERASLYFIFCFVGVITIMFIILLSRVKSPKKSPNFINKFWSIEGFDENILINNDLPLSSMMMLKANDTLMGKFTKSNADLLKSDNNIYEDYSLCKDGCYNVKYSIEVTSDFGIHVDEEYAKKKYYTIKHEDEKVIAEGGHSLTEDIFELVSFVGNGVNHKICELSPIKANIKVVASTGEEYQASNKTKSKGKKEKTAMIQTSIKKIKQSSPIQSKKDPKTSNEVYIISVEKVKKGHSYVVYDKTIDFSYAGKNSQSFTGRIVDVTEKGNAIPKADAKVSYSYTNFPNCGSTKVETDSDGKFIISDIPLLKNDIKNEITLSYDDSSLVFLSGGIGYQKEVNLGTIYLQKFLEDSAIDRATLNSTVIDSITLSPLKGVKVSLYENDVYISNQLIKNGTAKSSENQLYNYLVKSIQTGSRGEFSFHKMLDKEIYTIVFSKEGYYKNVYVYHNIPNSDKPLSFSLTPRVAKPDQIRISLEWYNSPNDLNLFSFFRQSSNDQCQVFYGSEKCQNVVLDNVNYNNGTQGAQVMTIEKLGNYTYTFAVKEFTINDDPLKRDEVKAPGAKNKAPEEIYPEFMRSKKQIKDIDLKDSKAIVKVYTYNYEREVYSNEISGAAKGGKGEWWLTFCMKGSEGIFSIHTLNDLDSTTPNYSLCEKFYNNK